MDEEFLEEYLKSPQEHIQRLIDENARLMEENIKLLNDVSQANIKSFAFKRPFCSPSSGIVLAKTWENAIDLIHHAYGYCSDVTVYDAETRTEHRGEQ